MTRRRAARPVDFAPGVCGCAASIFTVQVAGEPVVVDPDTDRDGDIGWARIGDRVVFTEAGTGSELRYRRHRCAVTERADMHRLFDRRGTSGPCRRYCGARVPHAYGPNAQPFCPACRRSAPTQPVDPDGVTG